MSPLAQKSLTGRRRLLRGLDVGLEVVVLVLVSLSPWAFASIHPLFESLLLSGVGIVMCLWAARLLVEWKLSWRRCSLGWCLSGLVILGLWQLVELPQQALDIVSPASAELAERLQPSQNERLHDGQLRGTARRPAGRSISLFPSVTRKAVIRLLAVFLLFAAVRNTYASPASLRRLCLVAVINGTLLTYFALAQFFSSQRNVLYWTYDSFGTAFGPFINRNHFAFYVNICIGLGVGLLLYLRGKSASDGSPVQSGRVSERSSPPSPAQRVWEAVLTMLRDTRVLATAVALATMVAGVVMCVSRGGVVALLVGTGICLLFKMSRRERFRVADAVLLVSLLAAALLIWLGFDLLESRLATLWQGDLIMGEGRVQAWKDTIFAVPDFPVWGTGYGTFPYIEPLYRSTAIAQDRMWGYAHNDYHQALVEGGTLRLMITLLAVALVYRYLYFAFLGGRGRGEQGLALGALFALTTVVLHAFVEFGLQMPAIACLVTVVCAHVGDLGERGRRKLGGVKDPNRSQLWLRLGGVGPVLGATCAILLGCVLHVEGRRADVAERFRLASLRAASEEDFNREIAQLEAAVRVTPENPLLHEDLAAAHFRLVELNRDGSVAVPASPHLLAAQRHYLLARDLCFLLPRPQVWLAANAETLAAGDPSEDYLRRSMILRPFDPQISYVQGVLALRDNRLDEALHSWRRSLELSPRFLDEILDRIADRPAQPTARDLLTKLFPDDPGMLFAAAEKLNGSLPKPERKLFLERALQLMRIAMDERNGTYLSAEDYGLAASIHRALDQPGEALSDYRLAIAIDPKQPAIRYAYATLLGEQGKSREAIRELRIVLSLQPNHGEARQLLEEFSRQ